MTPVTTKMFVVRRHRRGEEEEQEEHQDQEQQQEEDRWYGSTWRWIRRGTRRHAGTAPRRCRLIPEAARLISGGTSTDVPCDNWHVRWTYDEEEEEHRCISA